MVSRPCVPSKYYLGGSGFNEFVLEILKFGNSVVVFFVVFFIRGSHHSLSSAQQLSGRRLKCTERYFSI